LEHPQAARARYQPIVSGVVDTISANAGVPDTQSRQDGGLISLSDDSAGLINNHRRAEWRIPQTRRTITAECIKRKA
jgi:hypothetical protein